MYIVVSILIVVASVLLVLIVLVQNSKGGGLASNFQSSNQVMGVRKTTDFLEKSTWTLSIAILLLSIFAAYSVDRGVTEKDSEIKDRIENTIDPNSIPQFPTEVPAGDQGGEE